MAEDIRNYSADELERLQDIENYRESLARRKRWDDFYAILFAILMAAGCFGASQFPVNRFLGLP